MNILFIRYKKSNSVFEGGEKASQRNHDVLAQLVGEDQVTTYYIHDESRKRTLGDYLKGVFYFPFHYFFGLTPKRVDEIVRQAADYDVVYIDRSVFGIIAKKLKEQGYKGKVITFFHNVEVPYFEAKMGKKPGRGIVLRCADRNDSYACRYSDKTIVLSQRDDEDLFHRYGRHADVKIPIALKDQYEKEHYPEEMTSQPPVCLFIGANFTPNNEGLLWFVREVLPQVHIQFKVVGKGMAKLKASEPDLSDIDVVSDAPELAPYFEEADFMILPIFKGSGMKVKTCESLMYGKNIIGTDEAYVGYDVDDDKVGARCNTAKEFIDFLHECEQKPRPRFNAYSRQVFLEKYSEASVVDSFRQVLF